MRTDRRGFLRLAGAAFSLLPGLARGAEAPEGALAVHRATRNTRFGALGPRRPRLSRAPAPFKSYAGSPSHALPRPPTRPAHSLAEVLASFEPRPAFRLASVSLGRLGRVLYHTNGVTGRVGQGRNATLLRAAPSAGALYSGELYVLAERVQGLAPGLYYYDVRAHQLLLLRPGPQLAEVAGALERPGELAGAAAAVLLSNQFGRYTWRYANRGYRYALIDTGHIGENLRLAARSAGLVERSWQRFHDDRLDALCGLDGAEETVCALHAVGEGSGAADQPAPLLRSLAERGERSPGALPELSTVPERYHRATGLVPAAGRAPAAPVPPGPAARAPEDGADLTLPSAAPPMIVEAAILQRRSASRFRREPVSASDLGFVLDTAHAREASRRADGIEVYLIAHRAEGLAPGLYRLEARQRRLSPVRGGDLAGPLVRACLDQSKVAEAAVDVLMVGDLGAAATRSGQRSYRDLLVESGAIGQRVYLAAVAVGLVARNLAAFRDDALNELMGLDGRARAVLHLTALGPGS